MSSMMKHDRSWFPSLFCCWDACINSSHLLGFRLADGCSHFGVDVRASVHAPPLLPSKLLKLPGKPRLSLWRPVVPKTVLTASANPWRLRHTESNQLTLHFLHEVATSWTKLLVPCIINFIFSATPSVVNSPQT